MSKHPTPTWCFALVVVKRGRRFLLVEEAKHGGGWYLPAGRVEPGETFADAAVRETLEEAGVPVVLEGILRIERTPDSPRAARQRVTFLARPADDTPPKSAPDEHTVQARWFTVEEVLQLRLRGEELPGMLSAVLDGAPVMPLSFWGAEGRPW